MVNPGCSLARMSPATKYLIGSGMIFCTAKVKQAIESEKITNVRFMPLEEVTHYIIAPEPWPPVYDDEKP